MSVYIFMFARSEGMTLTDGWYEHMICRFQNLGEMMTLGRNDAAISPSFLEGLTLEGPIGHTVRKIAYLARLPTDEHRLKVGISWFVKSAVDSVTTIQSTVAKVVSGA
ncbi:alternative NAD(P)H-ubiquinone oxidoreductase C1, chloroplastic/mitochondrial-like isoform X1 [Camellia sinensis]|uniref:alternative NAD(P)H-ubiquinone oxidoreductase C1, chloroplastic/mitochondrial-like isoform X1 n=1 Tax=Camellia sinensis TaxID=4442 RepID=UPI001036A2AC|nr:alternative NAD(P)H-ubiquinone oxidoreductase C1, chloroplastic/mitochondrial-like isoform X1 [Camellia sinensis]